MTPDELLEHEEAWYRNLASLKLLGSWQAKLAGKRFTVIVYSATRTKKAEKKHGNLGPKVTYRCAVSFGQQILTSIILDKKEK
jgi:hypothetical protein